VAVGAYPTFINFSLYDGALFASEKLGQEPLKKAGPNLARMHSKIGTSL